MPVRWINLYGTDPDKRTDKTKGKWEGSSFLGRVMIDHNWWFHKQIKWENQKLKSINFGSIYIL